MDNVDILKSLYAKKPKEEKEYQKKYSGKKMDSAKFIQALNDYLGGTGITQSQAAEMVGVSTPTFLKYANMLYTEGFLDGSHFKDGVGIRIETRKTPDYQASNRRILRQIGG